MSADVAGLVARLRSAAEGSREAVAGSLAQAIEIPTENPPGNGYELITEHFATQLEQLGFRTERIDVPDELVASRLLPSTPELAGPRVNLLARRLPDGGSRPRICFYTHLDTVPAGDHSAWGVPPFGGRVSDGYVWGRGAADSKGNAVAIVWALRVLEELGLPYGCEPVIAFTTDEEIGGYSGLMHLVDAGYLEDCDCLYASDGEGDSVGMAALGGFKWRIAIAGHSVHSALAFLGDNPIERSAGLLAQLLELQADVVRRQSSTPLSAPVRALTSRDSLTSSLSITMAHGGTASNVIPSEFVLSGDRRFIPEEDEEACVAELERAIGQARRADPQLRCELSVEPFYPAFSVAADDRWVHAVRQTVSAVRGEDVPAAAMFGSTDVAYVARRLGMPVAIHGVAHLTESHAHGADERCLIDDLITNVVIVAMLIAQPPPGIAELCRAQRIRFTRGTARTQ